MNLLLFLRGGADPNPGQESTWLSLGPTGLSLSLIHHLVSELTVKSQINIFPLTCCAIYPSRSFCVICLRFEDVGCRVSAFSNTMELDDTRLVVLKMPNKYIWKNSTALSHSRNHAPVTQNNPQTWL